MRRLLAITSVLFLSSLGILAQTSNVAEKSQYSESVPYQPRPFEFKSSKPKKDKKSKKEKESVSIIYETENTLSGSTVKESDSLDVSAAVFDSDGRAITNLRKEGFKIFIDGEEKEIRNFNISEEPYNLILIIDTSPLTAYQIEEIQQYAANLVRELRPQDKVMLIKFDEQTKFLSEMTADRQLTNKAIKKLKFGDGTSFYEAVKFSLQKRINQIEGRKIVVMMTDGVDTTSRKAKFADSLLEAEKSNVAFFPVYVDTYQNLGKVPANGIIVSQQIFTQNGIKLGQPFDAEVEYALGKFYLNELASFSGGRLIDMKDFSKTKLTGFENFFNAYRNQYNLFFQPPESGRIGQRRQIKVRVNRPNLVVQTRGSYIVGGDTANSSIK